MITPHDNPNHLARIADLEAEVIRLQKVNEEQEKAISQLQDLYNGMRAAFGELHRQGQNALINLYELQKRLQNAEANITVDEANIVELYQWAEKVDKWVVSIGRMQKGKK